MLEVQTVSGGYGGETKLFDITLSVPDRTVLAIIGPNGCGKSTLLRIMGGIKKPYAGNVMLDGVPVGLMERNDLAKSLSFLPQSRNMPSILAGSMVLHGRFPYVGYPRRYKPEDRHIAEQAMEQTGVLPLRGREMTQLSGGERQKVYLAMMLAQDTKTVLMDEPTTYLDIGHQLEVMHLARRMKAEGKTVVMVLHDLNLALAYSDRVAVMQNGRLAACGRPEEVYQSGVLDEVFGVRATAQQVAGATQYFFEIGEKLCTKK